MPIQPPDQFPAPRPSRWLVPPTARPAVVAALLAAALFSVTLGGTYVYDDFDVFGLDPRLRDPGQWWRYWTDSYNGGVDNLYRPLVSMTYAVQWWLNGADAAIDESDAWTYHLVNLLLHAAVSAAVAELARRLAGIRIAYTAGLIFAAHPIHVEPVANIVGRAELMCALGVVGALLLFMRPLTTGRVLGITACFILAMLSKEHGMLTPLLLLILAISRRIARPPLPEPEGTRPATLWLIFLLCITLAAFIVLRESVLDLKFWWDRNFLDWTINPLVRPDADRWLMPLVLLGRYTALLVAPMRLSPDYGGTVIGWTARADDPFLWVGVAGIVVWGLWLILALRRRDGVAVFALLGLAATYAMASNIPALIGTNFGERLMYLPSAFFAILAASLLARLPTKPLTAIVSIIVALFCARSFTYAQRWNDRLSFYQTSLREHPGSVRLQLLLISEHLARGQPDLAAELARRATDQFPDYWEVWIARAEVAMQRGELDAAHEYLMTAANTSRAPMQRVVRWMTRLEDLRRATQPATTPSPAP